MIHAFRLANTPRAITLESNLNDPIDIDRGVKGKRSAEDLSTAVILKPKRTPPPIPPKPKRAPAQGTPQKKRVRPEGVGTPLQEFKKQTIAKRQKLKEERKRIDRDLKAIEKDLGVLKRKKKK